MCGGELFKIFFKIIATMAVGPMKHQIFGVIWKEINSGEQREGSNKF